MTAVNIRGTSGSGKSHLVRRILAFYPDRTPNYAAGRKPPTSYICTGPGLRPLFVLGHYEADYGGGADNVSNRDEGFKLLTEGARIGCDLIWEGVIYSDEVNRTLLLSRLTDTHIIFLSTPIEQCLADIRARREAKGNVKPLSERNTVSRVEAIKRACERLKYSQSVNMPKENFVSLGREEAYFHCIRVLNLTWKSALR